MKVNRVSGGASTGITGELSVNLLARGQSVSAYIGGTPAITLQAPPDPSYLKSVSAQLMAGAKVVVWRFEHDFSYEHEWSYPSGNQDQPAPLAQQSEGTPQWQIISRDYARDPGSYSLFRADAPAVQVQHAALATDEKLIAANIYPYAEPALAVSGTQALLLWTHDDVSKPVMQGEEIEYTFYDGAMCAHRGRHHPR